jgi:hypothetical protein
MTDFTWPQDLVPSGSSFKLQPHTGGSQSPFSRTSKIYELSAPLWTCSLSFKAARGSRWSSGKHVIGSRLDGIVAALRGRANRIAIWDFDFPEPRGGLAGTPGNLAALAGAAQMTVTGLTPGAKIYAGDYAGGDGRAHLIRSDIFTDVAAIADGSGHATIKFDPPLAANIGVNAAVFRRVTSMFRLAGDELGDNFNEVDQVIPYALQFVEDTGPPAEVIYGGAPVTFSG